MDVLGTTAHRPYPMPARPWRMRQRWNDLLFAHWPVRPEVLEDWMPPGLEADLYDGWAWIAVVPFSMDRVRSRVAGGMAAPVPGASAFPELNVRTYVRSRRTGLAGIAFFSLDAGSLLAVLGARVFFHLPYFWARMRSDRAADSTVRYRSARVVGRQRAEFAATYRGSGVVELSAPGSIEAFLTERYCLFTRSRGHLLVGDIHHLPWPLERAEAEFARNDVAAASGLVLPAGIKPLLHFSRHLEVYVWALRDDRADVLA